MNRKKAIIAFCIVSVMLFLGAKSLIYNLSPFFDKVDADLKEGNAMVMNGKIDASRLESLLLKGNYISDPKDAEFISKWYKEKIEEGGPLENLGALNLERFKIPAALIEEQGGTELKQRLKEERMELGQDEDWQARGKQTSAVTFGEKSESTAMIQAFVGEPSKNKKFGFLQGSPVPQKGVVVRLTKHTMVDTVPAAYVSETVGYAATDENGIATFYAPKNGYYSVIPIEEGYQFGQEKGTVNGSLKEDLGRLDFTRKVHALRPFKVSTYSLLKKDKALFSRSPAEFKNAVNSDIIIFIVCWLAVFAITGFNDRRLKRTTDPLILLSLMVLSGMGLLTLYGQMIPLTDIFYPHKMMDISSLSLNNFSGGIIIGCALLILLSCVDYLKFFQRYTSMWRSSKRFGGGLLRSIAPGLPFVVFALLLMVLLRLMGSGPEGSDARVNLFGFQPSEIVKYFIVFFLAFFFMEKGDVIKTFGSKMTYLARRRHWVIISAVVAVIAVVSVLFLAMLKDMGPGIVLLSTFILMYAVVRRDVPQLLLGILSYMVVVGASYILSGSEYVRVFAVLAWFAGWIWYGLARHKAVYESAIFFNALVSMFLVGGTLLRPFLPHMADRLVNRTNMAWSGIFDNAIPQGDQIAQGLWGTASGGFSGMGLGGGSSNFIPAGHTDLILNSLGEQMGWLGILIVVVCVFLLVSRTMKAAQYSGHKFTFYLCMGLGMLMGVQFLFIALGSVGAIPLSGVPVPLMSYSGTSMVMALASYGVVLSISRHKGSTEALKQFIVNDRLLKDSYDNREAHSLSKNIFAGVTLFFVGMVCVAAFNGYYQIIASAKTQLRPSITANATGMKVLAYNPRIMQLVEMLERGNIYDRRGLLLATSDKKSLPSPQAVQDSLGFTVPNLEDQSDLRLKRYYPLGRHTVFMVGDVNNPDVYANYGTTPMGYLAENENLDLLKGYETKPVKVVDSVQNHKFMKFMDPVPATVTYELRDYTALLPGLSMPKYNNRWVEEYNASRSKRDLHLTMDARLQTLLQLKMEEYVKNNLSAYKDLRASVVVMDARKGDMLSSANYPLPLTDSISSLRTQKYKGKSLDKFDVPSEWRRGGPVTERDLGLTFQTAPGSTAKVMTAMAGLKKKSSEMKNIGYDIKPFMCVEPPSAEPNIQNPGKNRNGGRTTYLEDAIKYSSNCYFIMLLNEEDLYPQLSSIYQDLGVSMGTQRIGDKKYNINSYTLHPSERTEKGAERFASTMSMFRTQGLSDYKRYMASLGQLPESTPWEQNNRRLNSIQNMTGIAWGQAAIKASPFNMARLAGAVGNGGVLQAPVFYKGQKGDPVTLLEKGDAEILASAMQGEASKHGFDINGTVGGKTGTPNRDLRNKEKVNDAWYMCYIDDAATGNLLSVALRIERTPEGVNSSRAVDFFKSAILYSLRECGYLG